MCNICVSACVRVCVCVCARAEQIAKTWAMTAIILLVIIVCM